MATSIPPHNVGELCAGAAASDRPARLCGRRAARPYLPDPDFPTGGVLVEPPDSIRLAYETGRGSFRLRARWTTEALGHGLYQIVVTEVPFQVQKGRLIEKIAALLEEKKLPLLADVRDESTEDVRLVLEPKTRNVDAGMLMEQLFRLTELETRVPLNLNVLDPLGVPRVMNLKEALQAFLDHRRVVLQRTQPPSARRGRPPHGDPARPDRRLRQSRRGDPHHPRGRRSEGRDDGALGADRGPGRGDPEHAAARIAPARGDRDPQGARRARRPRKDS